jgi:hypothetical protein
MNAQMQELIRQWGPPVAGMVAVLVAGLYALVRYRAFRAERRLVAAVNRVGYETLMNVMVPDGMDGHFHIDFLLLTQRGILIVDLRRVGGNIFGGDQMSEWAVMTRNRRFSFANPQQALYDRLAAVRMLAGDAPVEGRIVFTNRARFPKGMPKYTLMLESLAAEFSPVDKSAMTEHVGKFRSGWEHVKRHTLASTLGGQRSRLIF